MTRQSWYRLLLGAFLAFTASAQTIDEYQVKAAFLFNFAKFVEWPALTFKTDRAPMRFFELGQDPFGGALSDAVGGKTVLGRPFAVVDISGTSQSTECQMLFVSSSERKRLRSILGELRPTGVL